jgi:citrate synthase
MNSQHNEIKRGLEGVLMGTSSVSFIDGQKGRLIYRGYSIEDLAANCTYEEVSYLLIYGKLPTRRELAKYSADLGKRRKLPRQLLDMMEFYCEGTNPMEALRTTVSALACNDPDARLVSEDHHLRNSVDLVAKFPTIVASYHRIRNDKKPLQPKAGLGHSANFLYMLEGKVPDKISEKAFDTDMVLHAEHGMNASTFSARVTISTLSDVHSAITSAVGTLKGPLHGGAAQEVFRTLEKVGSEGNAEKYVRDALKKHEKVMGFGHRVYRTMDPRARILKEMCAKLSKEKGDEKWFRISEGMEEAMLKGKGMYPNVDFYSSSVYHLLGIPVDLDTPIFAVSRISGWAAHCLEQYSDNRLIRPRAEYVGEKDLKFVPLNKRK